MRTEEINAIIDVCKMGHPGPLSRACFDRRDNDCGLWGCQCRCHYVSAARLQRIIRADRVSVVTGCEDHCIYCCHCSGCSYDRSRVFRG